MSRHFRPSTPVDWARMWGGMVIASAIVCILGFLTWHDPDRERNLIIVAFVIVASIWAWVYYADKVVYSYVRYQCSCGEPLQARSTHYEPPSEKSPYGWKAAVVVVKPNRGHPVRYYAASKFDVRQMILGFNDTEHDVWRADGSVAATGTHSPAAPKTVATTSR